MKKVVLRVGIGLFIFVVWYVVFSFIKSPSLARNWTTDQQILAHTVFNPDGTVSITNIRNIHYTSTSTYTPYYYNGTYNPKDIVRAWFLMEPFGSFGAAHTLVSFEFKDGRYLSISAEIRKEKGETFSPLRGLLRSYELVYVIADEKDVIKLRTNYRKDDVYLYPIKGAPETVQQVFLDMLTRANTLSEKPEMYNTLTNNCTTNIVSHVRKFSTTPIPWWDVRYLFPATSDEVAYKAGLIDTDLSLEEAREKYFITKKAQSLSEDAHFSQEIRSE